MFIAFALQCRVCILRVKMSAIYIKCVCPWPCIFSKVRASDGRGQKNNWQIDEDFVLLPANSYPYEN